MKRFITTIVAIFAFAFISFPMFADDNNNYKIEGKTITLVKEQNQSSSDVLTDYSYKDAKGETYPIYIHKYTKGENAGSYTTYIIKTSKKTGKTYKYYIPNGKEIAREIINNSKNL